MSKESGYWTITEKEFERDRSAYFGWCEVGKGPHTEPTESEIVTLILNQYEA